MKDDASVKNIKINRHGMEWSIKIVGRIDASEILISALRGDTQLHDAAPNAFEHLTLD